MSRSTFFSFPYAQRYSKKLAAHIENPKYAGFFSADEAKARNMRLAVGTAGNIEEGRLVALYWLVDESDGVIADVKFQVYGPSALIGAAEGASELLIRKNYDQAKRVSADLLDAALHDKTNEEAFPKEAAPFINLVIDAIEDAAMKCVDIPFADTYVSTPMPNDSGSQENQVWPGWEELSVKQKISVIEQVIANDIRPYIELDAGGVEVLNLIEGKEVVIAYQGSCTSCYSATGATLNAIQQVLRSKVHPEIIVTPDLSFLQH